MLQTIRDKAKGWVAYAIIGLISIPFALFGIQQYFEGGGSRVAATVNGEEIQAQTVNNQLLQLKQRMPQLAAAGNDDFLKQMALDSVINQVLLKQQIEEVGYRASTSEVAKTIAEIPVFQKDGKFDAKQYENMLQQQRLSAAGFEEQVRQDITQNQLQQAISSTGFVPKSSAESYQSLRNQERDVELFTLKTADFSDQVTPTDEEIQTYFDQNKDQYMTQAKVKIAYIELDRQKLADAITIEDAELETFFDENADRYTKPEERQASRILLRVDEQNKDEDVKKKAEDLYAQLNDGKLDFAEAAKTHSQDEASKDQGGSMGVVVAGDWDPALEKAIFATKANEVAEPVKTGLGYEIVRVDSIKAAEQQTLDQVKERVERDYRQDQADKSFTDQVEKVQTLAFENNGDLAPAADSVGVEVQESDWFTRGEGKGIAESAKIREIAFSEDIEAGQNSDLIEVSDSKVAVLRSLDREAPKQKDLAEVKDTIVATLKNRGVRKMVAEKGADLLKQLNAGNDWAALETTKLGTADQVEKIGFIKRSDNKVARDVSRALFAMNHAAEGKTVWDSVVQSNGDYVVVALKAVKAGEARTDDGTTQTLGRSLANRELAALLKALHESAEIERFPEAL